MDNVTTIPNNTTLVNHNISVSTSNFKEFEDLNNIDKNKELDKNIRIAFTEAQIFYMLVGCLGVIGNGLSIVVFLRSKKLRKNLTNHFLINQSMIDFLTALCLLATIPIGNGSNLSGVNGYIRCVFFDSSLPVWATLLSSTYNLVALSIERWFQVTKPLVHKIHFTHKKAYIMMCIAWATGFIYETALAVATSAVIDGECFALAIWRGKHDTKIYGVITILTKYVAPISIVVFCYASMLKSLKATSEFTSDSREQRMKKAQKNVFKTLVIVVVAFIICVSYNQFIFLFFNLGLYQLDFTSFSYHISVALYFLNCCINPFIYVTKYDEFKLSLRKLLCRNRVGPVEDTTFVTANSQDSHMPAPSSRSKNDKINT